MKEALLNYFYNQTGDLAIQDMLLNYAAALVLGVIIFISYRYSHSGAVYSARFNVSLVMLTIVTTLVMNVIGNNVALSLGMVGALSIIRFRTAIKDPRDATYIFWTIAVGICCGVSEYLIAAMGTGIIFLFLLVFGSVKSNDRYLLIIHGGRSAESAIETDVLRCFDGNAEMRVKNTTVESVEYIYELSKRMVVKAQSRGSSITDILYKIEGVAAVNLVCQNEEISR
ncbi:MAG TPA: DUF4956 domain-containing protein [Ruminiclostridium sp.]|nr:DUF4956 domain-containing protein [Ruminiclostridium sp.]